MSSNNVTPIGNQVQVTQFVWRIFVRDKGIIVRLDFPDGKWWEYEITHDEFIKTVYLYLKERVKLCFKRKSKQSILLAPLPSPITPVRE